MADVAALIQTGEPAPDAQLYNSSGAEIALSGSWSERPALIFFLRHFGCALCRDHLRRIAKIYPAIQARGGTAVAVTFGVSHSAVRFAELNQLVFPILADPSRHAYRAFGLTDGHMADVFDPAALLRQTAQALRGNIPYITSIASASQRGGVFIVDRGGVIQLAHVATPIYNYPALEQYLAIFDSLARA